MTAQFAHVRGDETDHLQASPKRFQANARILDEVWDKYVEERRDEWIAVYGDGVIVIAKNMRELADEIPEDDCDTAVTRFLEPLDHTSTAAHGQGA